MNQMTIAETAYLAGIFDGEGWFICNNKRTNPSLNIAMTDFDIIERLHKAAGIGRIEGPRSFKNSNKPQLKWVVGRMDDLEDIIYAILPFLSARRTERAKEVLADIQERKIKAEWRLIHFVCGHEKSEDNTYHFKNSDKTSCRECGRISAKARYNKEKS